MCLGWKGMNGTDPSFNYIPVKHPVPIILFKSKQGMSKIQKQDKTSQISRNFYNKYNIFVIRSLPFLLKGFQMRSINFLSLQASKQQRQIEKGTKTPFH